MAELEPVTTTWNRQALHRPFDWANDHIRIVLVAEWSIWHNSYTSDISYANLINSEVKGSGYIAGGRILENKNLSFTGHQVRYRCNPVSWLEFAGSARSALIVNWEAEENVSKWVMAHVNFGEVVYGSLSPIIIRWNSDIALQSRLVLETT